MSGAKDTDAVGPEATRGSTVRRTDSRPEAASVNPVIEGLVSGSTIPGGKQGFETEIGQVTFVNDLNAQFPRDPHQRIVRGCTLSPAKGRK